VPYPGNLSNGKPHYYQPGRIRLLTTLEEEKKKGIVSWIDLLLPGRQCNCVCGDSKALTAMRGGGTFSG
jgi:hypothetical protein